MKAAIVNGLDDLSLHEVSQPQVKLGTILLKIKSCAICGSDVRILKSGNNRVKYPAIIGHEASGEIVAVGEDITKFSIGERVALGADVPCGKCQHCSNGRGNCCDENYAIGYQFPGAFAQYCLLEPMMVNYGPIVRIPDNVSYDAAALMEPLACVLNGFELANMQVGKTVLIIGAGPIGCLAIMVAKTLGASTIIVSELNENRLAEARKFGADYYINPQTESLKDKVYTLTSNQGMDLVLTMCPSVKAHEDAVEVVAKRGYVNIFGGLPKDSRKANFSSNLIHYKECFIMGSHGSTPRHNQIAMDLISSGKIDVEKLITHKFTLDEIHQGFNTMENLSGLKIIIKPNLNTDLNTNLENDSI